MTDRPRTAPAELRFAQFGLTVLKLHSGDRDAIRAELAKRVAASALLQGAPLVLDASPLTEGHGLDLPGLLQDLRDLGLQPLASTGEAPLPGLLPLDSRRPVRREESSEVRVETRPALHVPGPIRSGQQIYAAGRDLVVLGAVGAGAEVAADGSIHIYGALRGRALAGARGDVEARIYCQAFHAELLSVAGHYRVLEELPTELRGGAVQAWLTGERLQITSLNSP